MQTTIKKESNTLLDMLAIHSLFVVACNENNKDEIVRLGLCNLLHLHSFVNEKMPKSKNILNLWTAKEIVRYEEERIYRKKIQSTEGLLFGMFSYLQDMQKGFYGMLYTDECFTNFGTTIQEIMYRLANYLPE